MTREEYLKQLDENLASLTTDEKSEAIQYYSDYFEDAADDEKIMSELGTPEELAKSIVEKMANSLSVKDDEKSDDTENEDEESDTDSSSDEVDNNKSTKNDVNSGKLFYSFDKSSVKSMYLTFAASEVVIISGTKYSIETRGVEKDCLNVSLSPNGVLNISNNKRMNFSFWNHDRNRNMVPKILITVPSKAELKDFKLMLGAGSLETRDINLTYESGKFEVGAGNMILKNVYGSSSSLRCGMGNLEIAGSLKGDLNIDCGMGSVKVNISGDVNTYSYDAKIGLGDFRINGEKLSVVGKYVNDERKENNISVNCGLGSVNISIK